jgi:hypothetical protein
MSIRTNANVPLVAASVSQLTTRDFGQAFNRTPIRYLSSATSEERRKAEGGRLLRVPIDETNRSDRDWVEDKRVQSSTSRLLEPIRTSATGTTDQSPPVGRVDKSDHDGIWVLRPWASECQARIKQGTHDLALAELLAEWEQEQEEHE